MPFVLYQARITEFSLTYITELLFLSDKICSLIQKGSPKATL